MFNLGYGKSVPLESYITAIEKSLNKKAERKLLPMPLGDVPKSSADISKAQYMLAYRSTAPVAVGGAEVYCMVPEILRITKHLTRLVCYPRTSLCYAPVQTGESIFFTHRSVLRTPSLQDTAGFLSHTRQRLKYPSAGEYQATPALHTDRQCP